MNTLAEPTNGIAQRQEVPNFIKPKEFMNQQLAPAVPSKSAVELVKSVEKLCPGRWVKSKTGGMYMYPPIFTDKETGEVKIYSEKMFDLHIEVCEALANDKDQLRSEATRNHVYHNDWEYFAYTDKKGVDILHKLPVIKSNISDNKRAAKLAQYAA